MKNEAFVLVSENRVEFLSNGKEALARDFCNDDYGNFDEYVAAVVSSFAKSDNNDISSVRLVLPSAYYNHVEQVEQGVRSAKGEKYINNNFSAPLSSVTETDTTSYFETHTDYEFYGKSCKRLEDVPLLQKYLKRKTFLHWDSQRLSSLVSQLSQLGIEVSSVVPDIYIYNSMSRYYKGSNVVISINERFTNICIFSAGSVKRMARLQFGLFDIIRKLSNTFNLSYNNCRTLMNMYGFVFVPQRFVKYEIGVPVFEDVKKYIKLTDISYEIREMLKEQFATIYNEIKRYDVEGVIFRGLPVVDANVFFQMITKYDCLCAGKLSFDSLEKLFKILETNSYSETLVNESEQPQTEAETETEESVARENGTNNGVKKMVWFDSLMNKINQSKEKINALMME